MTGKAGHSCSSVIKFWIIFHSTGTKRIKIGVNTMILKDTEGIGFAIPIDIVYEEFGTTLE